MCKGIAFSYFTSIVVIIAHGRAMATPTAPAQPIFFVSAADEEAYFKLGTQPAPFPGRIITTAKNGKFSVVVNGCLVNDVKPDEKPRSTQISIDINDLFAKIIGASPPPAEPGTPVVDPCTLPNPHKPKTLEIDLKNVRSTVVLTAYDDQKAQVGQPSSPILTGPTEHWRLSVDLPVTNLKTLKYDSANGGTLQSSASNPQFYVGADYQFGDVLTEPTQWWDPQHFAIIGMLQASSKPLDSYGLAVGYAFPSVVLEGVGLSPLSIFVGYFETKQDAIVGGVGKQNNSYVGQLRVGISYNLSSAINKLKL